MRFEITGTANDVFKLTDIQGALKAAGAERVSSRRAFGWSNQPHVATFAAPSEADAERLADEARKRLGAGSLPALLPYAY